MILEKTKLAKRPIKKKWSFRKKSWYLWPQRWTWTTNVTMIRYIGDGNVYEHLHYSLIHRYQFSWLFIDFIWELDLQRISDMQLRHEPLQKTTEKGDLYY